MLFELRDNFQVSLTEHIVPQTGRQRISQRKILPPVPASCFQFDFRMLQPQCTCQRICDFSVSHVLISFFHLKLLDMLSFFKTSSLQLLILYFDFFFFFYINVANVIIILDFSV